MAQIIANAQELRWSGLTIPSSGLYIYLTDLSAQNDFAAARVQYDAINFSNYQYSADVCNSQLNKGSYAIFPVVWIMPGDESGSVVVYLLGDSGGLLPLNYNASYYGVSGNPPQAFEYQGNRQAKEGAIYGMGLYTPFLPQATKLATPTGLYADNITSDSARVSWTAVENASSYQVSYSPQGETVYVEPSWNSGISAAFDDLVDQFAEDDGAIVEEMFYAAQGSGYSGTLNDFSGCVRTLLYETTVENVSDDIVVTLQFNTSSTNASQDVFVFAYSTDGTKMEIAPGQYEFNWALSGACEVLSFQISSGVGTITFRIPEEVAYALEDSIASAIAIVSENIPVITNATLASYSPSSVAMTAYLPTGSSQSSTSGRASSAYLTERQTILNSVKNIDGLNDRIKTINTEASTNDLTTAIGFVINFNSNYLPLSNYDIWDPYTVAVTVQFANKPNAWMLIVLASQDGAIDVEKTTTDAQGNLSCSGTVDDITSGAPFYISCGGVESALPLDEDFVIASITLYDADRNTIPSSYYTVEYLGEAPQTPPPTVVTSATNSVNLTGLSATTTYTVSVVAVGDGTSYTDSPASSSLSFTTTLPWLSAPTGLTHDRVTSTSARVGWNAVTNAVDYRLEYREQGQTAWIDPDNIGGGGNSGNEPSGGTTQQEEEEPLMSETATQLKAAIAEAGMTEVFGSTINDADQFSITALFEISVSNVSDDAVFGINLDYPTGTSPGADEEYMVVLMLVDGSNVQNSLLDVINVEGDDTIRIDVAAGYEQLTAVEGGQAMLAILIRDSNAEATNATITDVSPDSTEITIVH